MGNRDPILGDPDVVARMKDEAAKGSLFAARPRYVREQYGDQALQALSRRLPEELGRRLQGEILPMQWFPFREMMELDRHIIEGPMQGRVELMEHFGATIAKYDLPTLYRMLFRMGSASFILKRIGVVYKTYLRPGFARADDVESNRATITIGDAVYPEYFCRYGVNGWLRAAIEMSGGTDVHVDHQECLHAGGEHCRWRLTWQD